PSPVLSIARRTSLQDERDGSLVARLILSRVWHKTPAREVNSPAGTQKENGHRSTRFGTVQSDVA
ncbi:hypothetical protein, partial [Lactiplantibacillus pentosus]